MCKHEKLVSTKLIRYELILQRAIKQMLLYEQEGYSRIRISQPEKREALIEQTTYGKQCLTSVMDLTMYRWFVQGVRHNMV